MQLENENEVQASVDNPAAEPAAALESPAAAETPAPELVPGRHTVRVWSADTGKAVEVKRSIDTGNTLDLWI